MFSKDICKKTLDKISACRATCLEDILRGHRPGPRSQEVEGGRQQGGQEPDQLFCSSMVGLTLSCGRGTLVSSKGQVWDGTWWWPLSSLSPLSGTHRRQRSTSGQVAGLASSLVPHACGKDRAPPPGQGDVWAGLCGESAARKGESLVGTGWGGEGVSVNLHACRLHSHCLPIPETQQCSARKQPSQPCLLRAHINHIFRCSILPFAFPLLLSASSWGLKGEPSHLAGGSTLAPLI